MGQGWDRPEVQQRLPGSHPGIHTIPSLMTIWISMSKETTVTDSMRLTWRPAEPREGMFFHAASSEVPTAL